MFRSFLIRYYLYSQAAREKRARGLAHETNRVGYHFPNIVVEKACTSLDVTLSSSGRVVYNQRASSVDPYVPSRRKGRAKKKAFIEDRGPSHLGPSQAEIDTEATQAIRDLFPNIPHEDLLAVVRLAFKKVGSRYAPFCVR